MQTIYALSLLLVTHCAHTDYRKIGYQAGIDQSPRSQKLNQNQIDKLSPKHKNEYHSGYQQGLKKFCVPQTGFEHGKKGYLFVKCPAELKSKFDPSYKIGHQIYQMEKVMGSALNGFEIEGKNRLFEFLMTLTQPHEGSWSNKEKQLNQWTKNNASDVMKTAKQGSASVLSLVHLYLKAAKMGLKL